MQTADLHIFMDTYLPSRPGDTGPAVTTTWEVEEGDSQAQGLSGQLSEDLFQSKKRDMAKLCASVCLACWSPWASPQYHQRKRLTSLVTSTSISGQKTEAADRGRTAEVFKE